MWRAVIGVLSYSALIVGALVWVFAAQDRLVNGADLLAFSLIVLGIAGAYKAGSADSRKERE